MSANRRSGCDRLSPAVHCYTTAFCVYLEHLHLPWRKTQQENLRLLGGAFLARRQMPIRRLARTLAGPTPASKTADKRLRRFLGNTRLDMDGALTAYLRFLLLRLGTSAPVPAVPCVPVMLDWTYVGERAILSLKVPYQGRSLPLLEATHEKTIEHRPYSQTKAEIDLLLRLDACWPEDAAPPLLLADRGFDKSRLIAWLLEQGWLFVIRSCLQSQITDRFGRRLEKRLRVYPGETVLHPDICYHQREQFPLHLVASCVRQPETGQSAAWHLICNVPQEMLGRVPRLYALRMQPEQTYRDTKNGFLLAGFGLSGLKRLRPDRLERYLFVLGLIYTFLVLLAQTDRQGRDWFQRRRGWGISLICFALDLLSFLGASPRRLRQRVRHACIVRLEPRWAAAA